ncbi:MAG: tRNA 2-thiouridine(34) synthase MnmA [SAR202 cluster bacterium]|nr:tRNA 2-thiouridine(34) synthase MnmA [SAR202 cluster bacterium]
MMTNTEKKQRVVVAMSGGVDSSVAAVILKEQGYEVIGITMRLFPTTGDDSLTKQNHGCCTLEDVEDAREVCSILGVPHYLLNFEKEFQQFVIGYFVKEYEKGKTPHPCVACNDKVKFNFLMQKAIAYEADYIATGHYAQISTIDNKFALLKGVDESKDQSYVLHTLKQNQLQNLLLPIGGYLKPEIRKIATDYKLPVANKPDSQEICFIPSGNYRDFIADKVTTKPGIINDDKGNLIGSHEGIHNFTVGQRKGLGISSSSPSTTPLYVNSIDSENGVITVGPKHQLLNKGLEITNVNFVRTPIIKPTKVTVKVRYKAPQVNATITPTETGAKIIFDDLQGAISPGQICAIYTNQELIGGGIITKPIKSNSDQLSTVKQQS